MSFLQQFTFWRERHKICTAVSKSPFKLMKQKVWLPGMGSNHELDRILKPRKLLILQSRRSRQKHKKQGFGTKVYKKFRSLL